MDQDVKFAHICRLILKRKKVMTHNDQSQQFKSNLAPDLGANINFYMFTEKKNSISHYYLMKIH